MRVLVAAQAPASEPEFLLAVQRALRSPRDRIAILVHLSRLREARAPLPPPHQLHLARSILQDAAQRFEGLVFSLRNGDLALLCRGAGPPAEAPTALAIAPAALPGLLARLFHADMARLVSVWPLDRQGDALLGYAADRLAEIPAGGGGSGVGRLDAGGAGESETHRPAAHALFAVRPVVRAAGPIAAGPRGAGINSGAGINGGAGIGKDGEPGALDVIEGIGALLAGRRMADLMHIHMAVRLRPSDLDGAVTVPPVFRELSFSIAALEGRISGTGGRGLVRTDPYLFRHLAGRLDDRMLGELLREAGGGGPLDPVSGQIGRPALHLNLTLPAILGDGFQQLLDACGGAHGSGAGAGANPGSGAEPGLGIEIAYAEACADPASYRRARSILAECGATLVLDGISEAALRLTCPWRLAPDLMKLAWSPLLADEDGADGGPVRGGGARGDGARGGVADEVRAEAVAAGLAAAFDRCGPNGVVLDGVATSAALAWGLARGIELFQGPQVDLMLAAQRIAVCPVAERCTTAECLARAESAGAAGRRGCGNTRLLDGGQARPQPGAPVRMMPAGAA